MLRIFEDHKKSGQAIMEMVLVLPLLLLLLLGTIDLGRLFFAKIVLTNASREGASYLSRHPGDKTNCETYDPSICYLGTVSAVQNDADSSGVTVLRSEIQWTFETPVKGPTAGEWVEVKVVQPADLIFGNILTAFGVISGPLQLESSTRMVVQ
jgi:Flp pilus assembly protein TadG